MGRIPGVKLALLCICLVLPAAGQALADDDGYGHKACHICGAMCGCPLTPPCNGRPRFRAGSGIKPRTFANTTQFETAHAAATGRTGVDGRAAKNCEVCPGTPASFPTTTIRFSKEKDVAPKPPEDSKLPEFDSPKINFK